MPGPLAGRRGVQTTERGTGTTGAGSCCADAGFSAVSWTSGATRRGIEKEQNSN